MKVALKTFLRLSSKVSLVSPPPNHLVDIMFQSCNSNYSCVAVFKAGTDVKRRENPKDAYRWRLVGTAIIKM